MTVQKLAREMGVGEKTIRRDLEAFLLAGFPVTETVGRFGRIEELAFSVNGTRKTGSRNTEQTS